ncbi:FAD-dependent oxidoreductase [Francisella sp. LA112445]|uniref:NAD(P)/FAD-dependent oxidoreductase n=1 Tax=Francisella sp. LA112445 TaxID=1395624 RepID=UPI001788C615|nr:FAD-dependent oxidoreductase [Francisella sp. LA112445]QIW10867.1 NADP transhydrogenase subunit alpha [Francisella sp. LA112445]
MKKVAIIGAGLAGLTVANTLKGLADITIYEKARGVSGRMSTRYADPYYFDHGAQYFTAKSPEFKAFIQPLLNKGIIKNWQADFVEIKESRIVNKKTWNDEYNHYIGCPRMNTVAQYLAKDLNILLNTRVSKITKSNQQWFLYDDNGRHLGEYDWVVLAIPSDQLREVLPIKTSFFNQITSIKMSGCFSLMLGYSRKINLGFDTALVHDEIVSWISLNSSKPDRNTPSCLLIHSSNQWADQHIDDQREQILDIVFDRVKNILNIDLSNPDYKTLHAWRYANIQKQNTQGYFIDGLQNIAACGDWCIKGRVESAFTSGSKLANQIKTIIS